MIAILLSITALAWDGERLYVARPGGVDIYRDGRIVGTLGDDVRVVMGLACQGRRLAECGGRAGEKGQLRIWEAGKLVRRIEAHADLIYRVVWSDDGKTLFTAGGDTRIGVIDVESGKVEYLEGHTGAVLALARHGELLVSGGADRTIRVWKGRTLLRSIPNHWDAVHALAFSPDGKYLASGSADKTVRIWQPEIGRLVRIVKGHDGTVLDLAWTPRHIVSACSDGKVRWMATDDVTIERELQGPGDWVNALCPAGERLYAGDAEGRLQDLH
ncbi:MAG TPA: WD40 repeat domain-containing protein [Planctomycetota bacterium]|jgi:WD40 repeat protein|nr:WD40 repeat domain-containing protein [Planctomycetota bacterium]